MTAENRRAHQCGADGCDSAAVYYLTLHVRYGRRHVAIETIPFRRLQCCDSKACRKAANDYLLNEHNKNEIALKLAQIGRLAIDWPSAMVEFIPLGEQPWGPEQMALVDGNIVTAGAA